jgi:hypothetical protein
MRRAEKQPNGRTVRKATKTTKPTGAKHAAGWLLACFEEQREEEKEQTHGLMNEGGDEERREDKRRGCGSGRDR